MSVAPFLFFPVSPPETFFLPFFFALCCSCLRPPLPVPEHINLHTLFPGPSIPQQHLSSSLVRSSQHSLLTHSLAHSLSQTLDHHAFLLLHPRRRFPRRLCSCRGALQCLRPRSCKALQPSRFHLRRRFSRLFLCRLSRSARRLLLRYPHLLLLLPLRPCRDLVLTRCRYPHCCL